MKAKLVNEAIGFERYKDPKEALGLGKKPLFNEFVDKLENDEYESEDDINWEVDEAKLIINISHNWSDEDYECDADMVIDFNQLKIFMSGSCENESIEVPGPGYMTAFTYSNEQEEEFSPEETIDDVLSTFSDWCGNFSYFAQQEGEEQENTEYCESCGEKESDCEKCERCGECQNDCECEEDDEDDDEDDEDDEE